MESIRIARNDIYTIEVNDKGETIEFDLVDIELPFKCERAWAEVNRISKELQAQLVIISKQEDTKQNGKLMTKKEEMTVEAYRKAFKEMRAAMDCFLGDGACQKIFGDRNYLEMFNDLFDALKPHLEKMEINSQGILERIKAKYRKKDDGVLR